jgi:cytoskeleton protein RodZ
VAAETPEDGNAPAGSSIQLVLSYSGDCWTEVTDATGRRLFFNLGSAGRTVTLSGIEPLGVLLGDSSNVTLRVNGQDYTISAADRRGKTARLTINGE